MADDSGPANSMEGGQKQSANQDTREKGGNNPQNHVKPSKTNKRGKTKTNLFDTLFGVLEVIALIFWILAEVFNDGFIHGFLLWLTMAFFLAGGAHLVHKAFQRATLVWTVYGILVLALGILLYERLHGSPDPTAPIADTKQQIRVMLAQVNPQALQMVDAGSKEIPIMICDYHGHKLQELAEAPSGNHYFSIQRTTMLSVGHGNKMGNYLNDQDDASTLTGYIILPTAALKSVPQ